MKLYKKLRNLLIDNCFILHDWGKWQTNGFLYQWKYCKKCNKRVDKDL